MITLQIYKAQSGQWSGRIIRDGEEIGRIAGCNSAHQVEDQANDQGLDIDEVEIVKYTTIAL